jgi:hypothetical protein
MFNVNQRLSFRDGTSERLQFHLYPGHTVNMNWVRYCDSREKALLEMRCVWVARPNAEFWRASDVEVADSAMDEVLRECE